MGPVLELKLGSCRRETRKHLEQRVCPPGSASNRYSIACYMRTQLYLQRARRGMGNFFPRPADSTVLFWRTRRARFEVDLFQSLKLEAERLQLLVLLATVCFDAAERRTQRITLNCTGIDARTQRA